MSTERARTVTVPAPIRGLNFKDSLAEMKPTDALVLDNLVCRTSYLQVRPGWASWVTGFAATVETLIPYSNTSGVKSLFACAGSGIYSATSSGAVGAALRSGFTSAYWNYTVAGNIGGHHLILVNGTDTPQSYDGTTWAAWAVTGVTAANLDFVTVWKRRVWAIEKNTLRAWYLPTDAVTGAMTSFDFKAIFQRGGRLLAIVNWSLDAGNGIDDNFLAITSEGEIAIYQGTDPASASTFSLKGVYFVGRPVGRRFFCQYGGDVLLLTSSGVIALSKYLQSTTIDTYSRFSDRIQSKIAEDIVSYGQTQGWELLAFFEENLVFVQVPAGAVGSRYQYVLNTLTGAWSKLKMTPVATLCAYNGSLYAGHSNKVANQWTGGLDDTSPIPYTVIPAFSAFGTETRGKRFFLARIAFQSDQRPTYNYQLLQNYNTTTTLGSLTPASGTGALWDTAKWNADIWGGATAFYRSWFSVAGYATSASLAVQGVSIGALTSIISVDYSFEVGGILG